MALLIQLNVEKGFTVLVPDKREAVLSLATF